MSLNESDQNTLSTLIPPASENYERRRRFHPKKFATPINDTEDDEEMRLLEPREKDQEEVDYVERAKQKIPRVIIALVVLLVFTNIVVLIVRVVRYFLAMPQIVIANVPLISWLWFVDALVVSLIILWLIIRIIFFLLDRIALRCPGCLPVYLTVTPYEFAILFLVWSVIVLVFYPQILVGLIEDSVVDDTIWAACWSIFAVSILYGIKIVIVQILEGFFYEDLWDKINASVVHEQYLIQLEKSHIAKNSRRIQQLLATGTRLFKEFVSRTLLEVTKNVDKYTLEGACRFLADKIIQSYDLQQKGYISELDLRGRMKEPEKTEIMNYFDRNRDARIDSDDLMRTIKSIYKERKELLNKIKSRRLMIDIIRSLLNFVFIVIFAFILLINFEVNWTAVLVSIGTALVALSFGYGATLQEVFDSLYMLFFVQPFNVGDFVQINDDKILIVEKVGVLSTYFHSFDGYGVFLRNAQISHSKISNLNRGGKISFEVQFGLNWDTTAKEVAALNKRLGEYFKNSKIWSPKYIMNVNSIEDEGQYLNVVLRVRIKKDWKWQDYTRWRKVKSDLILEIQKITDELDLQIEPYPQPIRLMRFLSDMESNETIDLQDKTNILFTSTNTSPKVKQDK
jgi:small-conductance mechanosensitive channel